MPIVLGRKPGGGGGSAGGVTSLAESGQPALTGAVTLSEGTNVTLTQVGQDIEIAASGGATAFPRGVLAYPPNTAWFAGNSLQPANDVVYVAVYVDAPVSVTHVIVQHQSAVGNIRVGIYSDDAGPDVLLASSGSVAAADVVALTAPVALQPGRYWAAMIGDNGGRRVYWHNMVVASAAATPQWYGETAGAYALPSPAAATVAVNGVVYGVFGASFP